MVRHMSVCVCMCVPLNRHVPPFQQDPITGDGAWHIPGIDKPQRTDARMLTQLHIH